MMPTSETETPLGDRLRRRISTTGAITFAEFVEAALYDPEHGFYARRAVGEDAHFVTSPHVSYVFGALVARQVEEFWELLDRPPSLTVIEAGAGTGTLARQTLAALDPATRATARYVAVERRSAAREEARVSGIEVSPALSELPRGAVGCVIANELLDNLPFHRVRGTAHGLRELFVGLGDDRFVLQEGPPSSDDVRRHAPTLRDGEEGVVNLEALRFIDTAAEILDRGYIWLVDYGWPAATQGALVHGYREHRMDEDVLANPGSKDITAGIDFGALAKHGRKLGLNVWGPVTQRDALMALGYREWEEAALSAQAQSLAERQGIHAIRTFSERGRARMLVDPAGLGGFYVMCFGVRTDRPPRSIGGPGR